MQDKQTAGAWREFHERLVQVITGWQGDNIFRISLDHVSTEEGEAPFVELNFVRPQVVVEVASNRTLAPEWRLTRTQQAMIRSWGLACPTRRDPTYGQTYRQDLPDEPACVVVTSLRDVFGVVDPRLLTSPSHELTPQAVRPWCVKPSSAAGARPACAAETDELVELALRDMVAEIERDEDGDICVEYLDTFVCVIVCRPEPIITICCPLGTGTTDPEHVVAALNDSTPMVKFQQIGCDGVLASIDMLVTPFVPEHLRRHVRHLFQVITDWDDVILPDIRDGRQAAL